MKKTVFVCVALALLLVTTSSMAFADGGGLYFAGKAGMGFLRGDESMSNNSTATGADTTFSSDLLSYGGAIGWNWLDQGAPIRTEIEYYDHGTLTLKHRDSNSTFNSSTDIQTLQFNFFYDFYTETSFIPYLGAGVGMASLKSSGEKTTNVSYTLFAGAAYKLTESLLLDMTYRINQFGTGKQFKWSDTNNSYDVKIKNMYGISAGLGLRYQF